LTAAAAADGVIEFYRSVLSKHPAWGVLENMHSTQSSIDAPNPSCVCMSVQPELL
jgi:hypothetical protein